MSSRQQSILCDGHHLSPCLLLPMLLGSLPSVAPVEPPPVSTLIGVSALVGPDWLIEIEAIAVVPE